MSLKFGSEKLYVADRLKGDQVCFRKVTMSFMFLSERVDLSQ